MYLKNAIYAFAFTMLYVTASAQNMEPKNKNEYSEVMKQCYTENLQAKWKVIEFKYQNNGVNEQGKKAISVSAKYNEDGKNWNEAPSCYPLAPMVITESYLKNIGKYGNDFKSIVLVLNSSGESTVQINGESVSK